MNIRKRFSILEVLSPRRTSAISNHLEDGMLMAYRDGELPVEQRQAVQSHIHTCEACQMALERIEQGAAALAMLSPNALEASDPHRTLASLKQTIYERKESPMFDQIRQSKRTQRTLAGVLSAVILVALFALPPVRALASEFLSLFRVQKFVVVDLDPQQMQEIQEALSQFQVGTIEGLDGSGEDVTEVASLDEAAALAGFTPRSVTTAGAPDKIGVTAAKTAQFTPDVEALRQVYAAVDVDGSVLPDNIDGKTFTFSAPQGIVQIYEDANGQHEFSLMQMPSPSIDGPADVDMARLGKAMLMLLGMSEAEAQQLSASIDWTSTMIIPVPTDLASVREIEVDGVSGLLFDADDEGNIEATGGALLWQKNGIVYAIVTDTMNTIQMSNLADALN